MIINNFNKISFEVQASLISITQNEFKQMKNYLNLVPHYHYALVRKVYESIYFIAC